MRPRRNAICTLFLLVLSTAAACSSGGSIPQPSQPTLADAQACLAAADYACAVSAYAQIDAANAAEHAAVLSGTALAQLGQWLQEVGQTLVATARMFQDARAGTLPALVPGGVAALRPQQEDNLAGDGVITRTVFGLLYPELLRLDGVIAAFDAALTAPPAAPIYFRRVPLLVGNVPVFLLSGEIGVADLYLMRSWLHLAGFLLETALAVDLEFSLADVAEHAESIPACGLSDDRSRRTCIAQVLAYALANTPNLLGPEPTRGTVFRTAQRQRLAAFYDDSYAFFTALAAETAPTPARQLIWEPRPQGGAWVDWTFQRIPIDEELIGEMLAGDAAAPSFAAALTTTVRFIVDPGVVEGTKSASLHLREGTPARIEVATSLLPVVTTGLEFLQQSDAVVRLLTIIAEGIDPDFAADLAELSRDVRALYSDVGSADAVHRLFEFLLPSSLEVNLHPIFTHPDYLRLLLPAAVSEEVAGAEATWHWLTEWECDEDLIELGFCSDSAELVDAPHFLDTPYAQPADGILSPVPYTAFADPGFGGLLWFDPWQVDPRFPRGITSPTLEQLNRLAIDVGIELMQRLASTE